MRQLLLTLLLALAWWAADAQTPHSEPRTDLSGVSDEQRAALEALEQGEVVQISSENNSSSETKSSKREFYTFDRLHEKYSAREGFTSIIFGKRMMQMMADRVRDEDRELARLLEELRSIRILINSRPSEQFEADARSWIETSLRAGMISLVEQDGQTTYTYLVDGGRWNTSTFVLLSFSDREQLVLHVTGYFSVKDISRLSEIRPK